MRLELNQQNLPAGVVVVDVIVAVVVVVARAVVDVVVEVAGAVVVVAVGSKWK